MKNIPIYTKTADYAIEHNELEAYRASNKANIACKDAVTDAINRNYRDYICDTDTALKELKESFSLERIEVVTAVTIRPKDWDLRFSQKNKDWAKAFPFPDNIDEWGRNRNIAFALTQVHPGLVNLFANRVREELELAKTAQKKPSLVAKLKRPLPEKSEQNRQDKGARAMTKKKTKEICIWVSEEEKALIQEKMKACDMINMSAYILKMAIDGMIINLDIPELKEISSLLRYNGNNINQIAKRLNSGLPAYASDIADIKEKQAEITEMVRGIYFKLAKL